MGITAAQCIAYAAALDTLTRALAEQQKHVDACEAMIRAHATAAAIFQPGGRFHQRANLVLSRSAVVDGIAWLVKELDTVESTLTATVREARAETEQLRREVNYQRARAVDAEARLAAESVRATAARASQP